MMNERRIKLTRRLAGLACFVLFIAAGFTTQAQTSTDQTAERLLQRIEKLEQALATTAEREKQLVARLDKLEQKQPAPVGA